jgi:peroxiredoxin
MRTIRFDPADRDQPSPYFRLESAAGTWISSADLCGHESQLLMFLHAPPDPACRDFLDALQARQADYARQNARLVAVFPLPASALAAPDENSTALLALADPDGAVRQRYTALMADHLVSDQDVMLFVMDENGGIYACLADREPDPATQDEILGWLQFISIQCPE